jgi:hypothetical protein
MLERAISSEGCWEEVGLVAELGIEVDSFMKSVPPWLQGRAVDASLVWLTILCLNFISASYSLLGCEDQEFIEVD